jgi:hypothetical protein
MVMFTYAQYEGGAMDGGRRPSIWDTFTHRHPGMCTASLSLSSLKLERVKHIKTIAIMFNRYMITSKFKHA